MAEAQVELPQDVKDQLPEGAQNIYRAAFKSAQHDGLSEEAAREVAWNTIKYDYAQGEDGKWHRKPDVKNYHNKAVPSGGN